MCCSKWIPKFIPILILAAIDIRGSSVNLVAVGSFGEALTSCKVEKFRPSDGGRGLASNYADRFRGLVALDVPVGQYEAFMRCKEGPLYAAITVDESSGFHVVARNERLIIGEQGSPKLSIILDAARTRDETWWVQLFGVYNQRIYLGEFAKRTDEVKLDVPDPGTYLVTVLSTSGFECVKQVDLFEQTRRWVVHQSSCTFDFDRYAHSVETSNGSDRRRSDWFLEMQKERESFLQGLQEATQKK